MKQGLDSLAALWSGHWCTVLNWLFFFTTKDKEGGEKVYFFSEGPVAPQEGGANPLAPQTRERWTISGFKIFCHFLLVENQGVSLTLSDLGGGNKEAEKNAFWCFGRFKAWEGASDTHSGRLFGETAKVRGFVWRRRTGACEKLFTRCLFVMYSHQPLYVQKLPIRGSIPQLSEGCLETGTLGSTCSLRSWW